MNLYFENGLGFELCPITKKIQNILFFTPVFSCSFLGFLNTNFDFCNPQGCFCKSTELSPPVSLSPSFPLSAARRRSGSFPAWSAARSSFSATPPLRPTQIKPRTPAASPSFSQNCSAIAVRLSCSTSSGRLRPSPGQPPPPNPPQSPAAPPHGLQSSRATLGREIDAVLHRGAITVVHHRALKILPRQ